MLHVALNDDCKGAPLSLLRRRIGNGRAVLLGVLHCLLDVVDREVTAHDRLFVRGQGLPDTNESSVCSSRNPGLSQVRVRRTKGETVDAMVEPGEGFYVVADDLQVVNGQVGAPWGRALHRLGRARAVLKRHAGHDGRAVAWLRVDDEFTRHELQTLPHARQTETTIPRYGFRAEPAPSVTHGQGE